MSISAHRLILSAGIPYFRKIFSSENKNEVINLPNIAPDVLECLIDYAYTCEVNINADNVKNLLTASCYLNIEEVKQACCDYLLDGLEPESAWSIRELAISLECPRLLEGTDSFIMENFDIMWKTNDFLNYPSADLRELIEKDDLNVESEKEVLEAVLRWVKESPDDRKDALPQLLQRVRLSLLEPLYLRDIVQTEELLRTSVSCRDIIDDCKDYNLIPEIREKFRCCNTQPRRNRKEKFASQEHIRNPSIFKLEVNETYSIEYFDFLEEKWSSIERENNIRSGSAVYLQNKMYFFDCSTTLRFDPRWKAFGKMRAMSTWRQCTGVTDLKNKIYICGGRKHALYGLNVVQCFDPEKDEWTTVISMPTSRHSLNAVTLGEYIFTLGGRDLFTVLDSVEKYEPKRDKWTSMSSMLTARYCASAATLNGKIYVCGGSNSSYLITATAEVYDPIKDRWVFISSMNTARRDFTLLACEEKLYAIGGYSSNLCTLCESYIYDPGSDKWTVGAPPFEKCKTSGVVVMSSVNK